MNATELDKHQAFHQWYRANFSTRYTLQHDARYLTGGRLGFYCHPERGAGMVYQCLQTGGWWKFDLRTRTDNRTTAATDLTRLHLTRDPSSLRKRLRFWQAHPPWLTAQTGSQSNIRQIAQLAVILDYKTEAENLKS